MSSLAPIQDNTFDKYNYGVKVAVLVGSKT